jgi:hypothetical protein
MQGGSLGGLGWWREVFNLKNILPSLGCHSIFFISVLPSAFFSCAWTVIVIDILSLRQCFLRLPRSTEVSISGTSRKLPLCLTVSQHVLYSGEWPDMTREITLLGELITLTVNVIGLLFLQQCLVLLPHSKETLNTGMSRKLPICLIVSRYAY